MNVTPENILQLNSNEIFVFGSNLAGKHGLGAAKQALQFGAKYGKGLGLHGKTFAVPTKDKFLKTLPIDDIEHYVSYLLAFVLAHNNLHYLITKIGCGLAGYSPVQIAPIFYNFRNIKNVSLPQSFINILK